MSQNLNFDYFKKSYKKYCSMVASTLKLNIEKSLNTKKYTPDEFQFLLAKHTEQVRLLLD